jgi:hypothetical protein
MPFIEPSRSDVHVDGPLTNISVAFLQDADNFVADKVFPNIPVSHQSDVYYTYPKGEFNRDDMELRAPGTESAGANYKLSTDNYSAPVRALHKDIADQVRANSDSPLSPDREATEFLTGKALINREVNFAANYFVPSVWDTDVTSGLNWDDAASTPIADVRTGVRTVLENTGFKANTMVMGRTCWDILVDHPDLVGRLDRGQTSGPARVLRDAIAALFEIDQVLVMEAIQNTAGKGLADSHSFIGTGVDALLVYAAPSPGLMVPSAGYTFSWTGFLGASQNGMRMKRFRMDHLESDRIEIDSAYDQKLVASELGYFFDDVTAA